MIVLIHLTPEEMKRAEDFAIKKSVTTEKIYRARRQSNSAAIIAQSVIGHMGEIATYKFLTESGFSCSEPNDEIYTKGKNFIRPDFNCEQYHIHVKSQSVQSANKYGTSWTFQKSSTRGRFRHQDPILTPWKVKDHDMLACCICDPKTATVSILACLQIYLIHQNNLFEDPVLNKLKGLKKVIYFDDQNKRNLMLIKDKLWNFKWMGDYHDF